MISWKYPALIAIALLLALVLIPGISAAATEQEMDNENVYGILSGPTSPTTFTFSQPVTLTHIGTYHYHDKNKVVPLGTLGLRDASGKIYGPWMTTGLEGQGGVKDAFWDATPNVVIPAGTYTVVDSDPKTWSYNKQSNYQGFASVRYIPVGGSGGSSTGASGGSSGPHFAWPTAEAFASAVATSALVGAFGFGGALFGAIVGGFTFIPPRGFQYPDRFGGGPTPYDPGYDAGWGNDSDGSGSGSSGSEGEGSDSSDAGDGGGEGDPGPGPSEGSAGLDSGGAGAGSVTGAAAPGSGSSSGGSGPMYGDGSTGNPFRDYADANNPPWAAPFGTGNENSPFSDTQQPVNDPGAEGGDDGGSSDTGSGEGGKDGSGGSGGTGSGEGGKGGSSGSGGTGSGDGGKDGSGGSTGQPVPPGTTEPPVQPPQPPVQPGEPDKPKEKTEPKKEPEKPSDPAAADAQILTALTDKTQALIDKMKADGKYVSNATNFQKVWYNFPGKAELSDAVFGSKRLYCEEAMNDGKTLLPVIQSQFGKDAKMGVIVMDKSLYENHVANYVKLPDGKSYVVDVWRSMIDGKPAIYTEDAWKDVWKKELGGEPNCYIAMDK